MPHYINKNLDVLVWPESYLDSNIYMEYPDHYQIPTITSGFDTEMLSHMNLYEYAKLRHEATDKNRVWPEREFGWSFAAKIWYLAKEKFNLTEDIKYYLTPVSDEIKKYGLFDIGYLYDQNRAGIVVKKPFYIHRDDIMNQNPDNTKRIKSALYDLGYIGSNESN